MEPKAGWLTREQGLIWRSYLVASHRISDRLDNALRPHGLDLAEYEILVVLSEAQDRRLRMSDISIAVHQSRSRLTHAITRMEAAGWVRRTRSPEDRRGVIAHLTDAGMEVLVEAAPIHVQSVRDCLIDVVAPDDLLVLGRAMAAVLEATADSERGNAILAGVTLSTEDVAVEADSTR